MDPDFGADAALVSSVCGHNSELRLIVRMTNAFPGKPADEIKAETVLHTISAMANESVYKMANKTAQVKHGIVKKMLCSIVDEHCPDVALLLADKGLTSIFDKLRYFVSDSEAAASNAAPKKHVGIDALRRMLGKAESKLKNKDIFVRADVKDFITFMFLIPEVEKKKYVDIIALAVDDATSKLFRQTGKKKPSGSKGTTDEDRAVSEAMAMFA